MCAKVFNESKYQFLIKRRENVGTKHLHDPKAFIEYSNTMDVVYNNIDDYNPNRNRRILVVFDDMILDTNANKKVQSIIKEPFIRYRKLNVSLAFFSPNLIFLSQKKSDQNQTKLCTLLNIEDSKQNRSTTNSY